MLIVAEGSNLSARAAPGNRRMLLGTATAACQQHLRGIQAAISLIPAPGTGMLQRGGGTASSPLPRSPAPLPKEVLTRATSPASPLITESLRLEKTSKIIQSNCQPNTTMPVKPCPEVPRLRVFWHFTKLQPWPGMLLICCAN